MNNFINKAYAEIDVETVDSSDLAVRFNDGDGDFWIPKSVMKEGSWPDLFDSGTVSVEVWFAEKEGLV